MALMGGHRFAVSMANVFPHGVYALMVEQAQDFNEKTRARIPAKDKQTGELVWTVTCMDRDPDARVKEVKVKVSAPVMPVLPEEIIAGSGIRCVDFEGLTITPYIEEPRGGMGRARLAYSYRATAVYPQGKAPTGTSGPTGPGSPSTGPAAGPGAGKPAVGDGKAA
jgi:hypothetical protein